MTFNVGQTGYIVGGMTIEDEALANAIVDQINAELGASSLSMRQLAKKIGRPYDSTRNYLKKERPLPFGIFFEIATAISVPAEEIISRARARL